MLLPAKRFDHPDAGERFLHGHDHLPLVFQLVPHGVARAPPINADGHETNRKKDQGHNGKLPIHQEENSNSANDRKPARILLKKSMECRTILEKSWFRMSVTTLLLTHCM